MPTAASTLGPRLDAVADLVRPGEAMADLGCDHALLPIYLLARGRVPAAYGCDLRPDPLTVARANARRSGEPVELRLGDGLAPVAGLALGTATIAGMGGDKIAKILDAGPLHDVTRLVVAPNASWTLVREALHRHGFWPLDERLVEEAGRLYLVLAAERGGPEQPDPADFVLGPLLRQNPTPLFRRWLEGETGRLRKAVAGIDSAPRPDLERRAAFEAGLGILETALARLDRG